MEYGLGGFLGGFALQALLQLSGISAVSAIPVGYTLMVMTFVATLMGAFKGMGEAREE